MAIRCNNEILPISIHFEDRNGKSYHINEIWDNNKKINANNIPILKENAMINARFYGDGLSDFDEEAVCKIQTSLFNDLSSDEVKQFNMSTTKEKFHSIYDGSSNNNEPFPWRMGVYFLEILYKGKKYYGGINVLPHHLDKSQVEEVHNFLNNEVEGLIYDFVYSNKEKTDNFDYDLPKYWYYNYARKLAANFHDFMYAISTIIKNPTDRIISQYKPSLKHGKVDKKSIRWSYSNKGATMNSGSINQQYTLSKTKVTSYNESKENQWVKNILLLWEKDVFEVSRYINNDIVLIQHKKNKQQKELDELKHQQTTYNKKRDIAKAQMNDFRTRISMIESEINKSKRQILQLQKWHELLKTMENKLVYFLNKTFLYEIHRGMRKPFLKKYHYHRIDTIFNELKSIKEETGEQHQLTQILKPTWQIYEYYCLFKTINILKKMGFILIEGLDEDIINLYFDDQIQQGTKFIFRKNDIVIHIWYDHYHAGTSNIAKSRNEFFYTNSSHRKPDMKMDFFQERNGDVVLLGTIVFDSKFSRLRDIYNQNYMNKTTEQLLSYYIFFYNEKKDRKGSVVDKVVCMYAGDESENDNVEFNDISFVKFHPSKLSSGDEAIGESQIFNIIETTLSNY
ncbi:hypothetical protein [Salibacterium qingdaonense]|uniref:DUF2357 domain-containing protein n=1 Tax=Salibacterium qingdaonense TaxID=266892 RepID=A0A1I4QY40_9BACI|nr:hypothetical protein [Salibacterium qingdaonense]SFM44630.1 hypothetical protein SAMN04488054_1525 [Salibacterium qingdaonense]